MEKFLDWVETSPFFGKNALTKAAEYTLSRANGLKVFLNDGRIEIDNNPAENAIRPNVIGRKNWLFSVSEASAKANAICLSIAETAKTNGVDFYRYLLELLTDLPNLDIHRNPETLNQYMPWSKNIQASCGSKIAVYRMRKINDIRLFVVRTERYAYSLYFGLTEYLVKVIHFYK